MGLSKKAIGNAVLVSLILTMLSFGLLGITISKAIAKGDDLALEIACKESIDLRASTVLWAGDNWAKMNLIPPICTTIDKKIDGDREEIMQEISDLSARCWWMFGEGRYEELLSGNEDNIKQMLGFDKTKNDCFICYSVLIEEDEIEGSVITSNDLLQYMDTEDYPKVVNHSYLDYIQEYGGPGRFAMLIHEEDNGLVDKTDSQTNLPGVRPRGAYAITYLVKNKEVVSDEWTVGKIAIGTVGAVAVVSCVVATAGICAGVGIGATTVALGTASLITVGSGISDIVEPFYSERDVSSVYLDDLRSAQSKCSSGDIAGK